jgi:hypothetical protein
MTHPIAWHLLERVYSRPGHHQNAYVKLELIPGKQTTYNNTAFSDLEGQLCGLDATVM